MKLGILSEGRVNTSPCGAEREDDPGCWPEQGKDGEAGVGLAHEFGFGCVKLGPIRHPSGQIKREDRHQPIVPGKGPGWRHELEIRIVLKFMRLAEGTGGPKAKALGLLGAGRSACPSKED